MTARVRVPASSSNLGAGFDCVGIVIDRAHRKAHPVSTESL